MPVRELLTDTEFETFRELKETLISLPIVAMLRQGYKYASEIDECQSHVGCTLMQGKVDGDKLQAGCESRSVTDGGNEISLDEEVPCFSVEVATAGPPDKQPAVWR